MMTTFCLQLPEFLSFLLSYLNLSIPLRTKKPEDSGYEIESRTQSSGFLVSGPRFTDTRK